MRDNISGDRWKLYVNIIYAAGYMLTNVHQYKRSQKEQSEVAIFGHMLEKDTVKFHKKAFGLYLLDIPFMLSGEPIFVLFYFEMKRYCFGFVVNYLHNGGYYPIRKTLVTTMSTPCTKGKQSHILQKHALQILKR